MEDPINAIPSAPGNRLIDLGDHTTAMFYRQLLDTSIVPPALEFWRQTLQPQPSFNSAFWANVYPPLASNRLGDLNWKVAHRVLLPSPFTGLVYMPPQDATGADK